MDLEKIIITAVVFAALYKIVEVIIHRKERITLVDKLDKLDLSKENNLDFTKILGTANKNWALRLGSLLIGIGLGVLVGYWISAASGVYLVSEDYSRVVAQQSTVIYSSCTLLFGGIGLLASFLVERKLKDE